MGFSIVPTVSNGDTWSAANHNTYIRDNFAAVWAGSLAGDVDYYTSATTKATLHAVASKFIRFNAAANAIEAVALSLAIAARQGGSATDYAAGGTTNYAASLGDLQVGVAFSDVPIVYVPFGGYLQTTGSTSGLPYARLSGKPTATSCAIIIQLTTLSGDYCVPWFAIGTLA
jgi:hypothetical protein